MSVTISGSGQIVKQVAQQVFTTYVTTTSTSFIDTGITVNITPTSASNKILVTASVSVGNLSGYDTAFNFVRNGTNIGVGTASTNTNSSFEYTSGNGNHVSACTMTYLDSPATTSALTYKLQWRSQASGTAILNAGPSVSGGSDTYQSGYISTITVQEISGS